MNFMVNCFQMNHYHATIIVNTYLSINTGSFIISTSQLIIVLLNFSTKSFVLCFWYAFQGDKFIKKKIPKKGSFAFSALQFML